MASPVNSPDWATSSRRGRVSCLGPRGLGTEIQRQTQGWLVIPSDRGLSFWHMDAVRFLHCLKSPHLLLDELCEVLPLPQVLAETLPPR